MRKFLRVVFGDQSGVSAAEYALILAIIGTAIAIGAIALGGAISGSMNGAANCIDESASC